MLDCITREEIPMPSVANVGDILASATQIYLSGDLTRAVQELAAGERFAIEQDDRIGLYLILVQKAGWQRELGDLTASSSTLKLAEAQLSALPEEDRKSARPALQLEQAICATRLGEQEKAIGLLTQAKAEATAHALPLLSDILANLCSALIRTGKREEAQKALREALELDRKLGNSRGVSSDLNMLGMLYKGWGDLPTAKIYLEQAASTAGDAGLKNEFLHAMANLAEILLAEGKSDEANAIYEKLRKGFTETGSVADAAATISSQGIVAAQAGRYDEALELFAQSIAGHEKAGHHVHILNDLINIASTKLSAGQPGIAPILERAIGLATTTGNGEILWRAFYLLARVKLSEAEAASTGDRIKASLEQAREAIGRSMETIDLLRSGIGRPEQRQNFLENKEEVYGLAMLVAGMLGDRTAAFSISERSRGRSFLEMLGQRRLGELSSNSELQSRREALTQELLGLAQDRTERRNALLAELREVRGEIIATMPEAAALTEGSLPALESICSKIPDNTCLVEFFVSGKFLSTFVLTRIGVSRMTTVDLGTVDLDQLAKQCRQELENDDLYLAGPRMAFDLLFAGIWKSINGFERLIIVPHGPLNGIPFSALWFENDSDKREKILMGQRFLIVTVPSAAVMFGERKWRTPSYRPGNSLVMGNPTCDLPGSELEAKRVAALLGTTAVLRADATSKAFFAASEKLLSIIHIASHGNFQAEDPLLSGFDLADRTVTAEEFLGLTCHANLLVLSGCFTGFADRRPGEELVGLVRAANIAGVPSVVAALWEIDDDSAPLFFEHFYGGLARGIRKDEAFRAAQFALICHPSYSKPSHWAPFVLFGDWR
jgi:CHAT domain-containing protein/tetratricopeptide (TPR) repeat protein